MKIRNYDGGVNSDENSRALTNKHPAVVSVASRNGQEDYSIHRKWVIPMQNAFGSSRNSVESTEYISFAFVFCQNIFHKLSTKRFS